MEAYQGYIENGRIVLIGNPKIPDGSEVIITVLDQPAGLARAQRQKKAMSELWEDLADCEPLGPEFDNILSQGFQIAEGEDVYRKYVLGELERSKAQAADPDTKLVSHDYVMSQLAQQREARREV